MRPFVSIGLVVMTIIVFVTLANQVSGRPELEEGQKMRRSLCNTFGGCGRKRSVRDSPYGFNNIVPTGYSPDTEFDSPRANARSRQEINMKLAAEAVHDLIDYLQVAEKNQPGRYMLVLPKSYDPSAGPISLVNRQASGSSDLNSAHQDYPVE